MRRYPSANQLLDEAAAQAGLADFGPGDFRDGLAVLLDSLERDGDLDPGTDAAVIGDFRRRLVNRLKVEAWYGEHPEVADVPVLGPVDINGLPRTGTTALADMLSLDPRFRCLRGWEQAEPCPPPTPDDEANDPRRLEFIAVQERRSPESRAKHLVEVDATMEDTELLGMAFHGQQMVLPVAGYRDWWREADLTSTYQYHRRVVKLLGSRRPPQLWLFKAPHHKFHLEALAAAYPDIRFVMTHRDPAKVVPSYSSLVSSITPPAAGERDLHRLGREISDHLRSGLLHAIDARKSLGEDRFLDVHHRELVADPKGTVRRIYAWLGFELTPAVERTILDWQQANRMGAAGTHRYTAEQFGLSTAQIRADYDFYIRHFDVAVEG
ncbi:sulfotransferase family protein [Pseudofrankia inefficax]|uniref:Sulfotransferase n=1 Tax=Pseudofrankia inefficax (strain DSM 45817 / CECT 9037 / DDB 130130 / EuI1c) TaxID=298654 RepID=E3J7I5_PSEI1|nr:sulfotransferase [Pseudofrankia inefficax]ADP79594.1 sulfotransferase [Pseudofrankia inefficax]